MGDQEKEITPEEFLNVDLPEDFADQPKSSCIKGTGWADSWEATSPMQTGMDSKDSSRKVLAISKEQIERMGDAWALKLDSWDQLLQQRNQDLVMNIHSLLKARGMSDDQEFLDLPSGDITEDLLEDDDFDSKEPMHEAPLKEPQSRISSPISSPMASEPASLRAEMSQISADEGELTNGDHRDRRSMASMSSNDTVAEAEVRTSWLRAGRNKMTMRVSNLRSSKSERGAISKKVGEIFHSMPVQSFFSLAIITNCALIGVQVQWAAMHPQEDNPTWLAFLSQFYAAVFLMELVMQIISEGAKFFCMSDCAQMFWNYLDISIVGSSLVELALFAVQASSENKQASKGSSLRIVRILRVARLIRVVRLVRLVKVISSLRRLIQSILSTMTALGWSFVLLFMIMYMFGIIFADMVTTTFQDTEFSLSESSAQVLETGFKDLHKSMMTLFFLITNGSDWGQQFAALFEIHWLLGYTLVVYVAFSMFAVLNVMTGTFCQFAIESANRDQDLMVQSMLAAKQRQADMIRKFFDTLELAESKDGAPAQLSLYDFENRFQEPEVLSFFQYLDINTTDAWTLFKLLSPDGKGTLNVDEFVEGCLRLKGAAKKVDVAVMMREQRRLRKMMNQMSRKIEDMSQNSSAADPAPKQRG